MEVVDAISDPEFDVIHSWRPRDRVIIRKDGRLPGEKKRGHLGESLRIGGTLVMPNRCEGRDLLAWEACDHRGHRKFVSVTTKEGNLVGNVRQYAILRERQGADYHEFQPEGTPLQQTPTWPGPPTDPPAEKNEMEVEDDSAMDCA